MWNRHDLRHALAGLVWAWAALLAMPVVAAAPAATPALDQRAAIEASQSVLGKTIGDFTLLDREGKSISLAAYRGKPLLVSFIYTGCFEVCPTTTRVLEQAMASAQAALGKDTFNVVSIGFNQPNDSPTALKTFALQHGIRYENWDFLSPPMAVVEPLSRAFGFTYAATPAGFDHVLQVSIVDAEGKLYRQIYGDDYTADHLIEPLRELLTGAPVAAETTNISALIERVRILCTVYDPLTGKYKFRWTIILEIIGGVIFFGWLTTLILREWLAQRRAKRTHPA